MKPILDEQSAITYSSVVILVLTFFIYLVSQHPEQGVVESRLDGVYRSFGLETPREQLISRTSARVQSAFLLPVSYQGETSGARKLDIPLNRLFGNGAIELRASALAPLRLLVDVLTTSAISAELVVQQVPVNSLNREAEIELGLHRVAAIIRYFNDSGVDPQRFSVKARAASGPWQPHLSIDFGLDDSAVLTETIIPLGNKEGGLRVG